MTGDYTRWYKTGSVNVTQNSKYVTGTNTNWNTAGLKPGDIFSIDDVKDYEIESITDNTHLVLVKVYAEASANSQTYSIKRQFNATTGAQVAAQATALFADVKEYVDGKQSTIRGKSAYELAVQDGYTGNVTQWLASLKGDPGTNGTNGSSAYELAVAGGYTGTQAQWLEDLKADNEWSTLDARTDYLTHDTSIWSHNRYRGKNLGSAPTEAQLAEISARTYGDLQVGDYWALPQQSVTSTVITRSSEDPQEDGDEATFALTLPATRAYIAEIDIFSNAVNQQACILYIPNIISLMDTSNEYLCAWNFHKTAVGYKDATIRRTLYSFVLQRLKNIFGEEHLDTWTESVTSDTSHNYVDITATVELPSRIEVYGHIGSTYHRTTGFDTRRGQLALFKQIPPQNIHSWQCHFRDDRGTQYSRTFFNKYGEYGVGQVGYDASSGWYYSRGNVDVICRLK